MAEDVDYIGTIREANASIEVLKKQIKTKKEMLDDHIQQKPEWFEWQTKVEEANAAKAQFNAALKNDSTYNNEMENLADLKEELKDKQDTLSTFIVSYYAETKESQVEMDESGTARRLVVTGKLGKKEKYQTNIFNQGESRLPYKD